MKIVFLLIAFAVGAVMCHSLTDKGDIDLKIKLMRLLAKIEDDLTPSIPDDDEIDFGWHDEKGAKVDIDAPGDSEDDAKPIVSLRRYVACRQLRVRICI